MVVEQDAATMAERFTKVATGHVCDALEHVGVKAPCLSDRFRPLTNATHFAGPAVTLELAASTTGEESRRLNELLEDSVTTPSVVVIDAHGITSAAVFGDRAAFVARSKGATGAVLNGGARDVDGLNELGDFPVHAIARALPASEGKLQGLELQATVVLDGVRINVGDWIVGDESGICVVPADLAVRVLELAEEREEIDDDSMEKLRQGSSIRAVHRHFKDDDIEAIKRLE